MGMLLPPKTYPYETISYKALEKMALCGDPYRVDRALPQLQE